MTARPKTLPHYSLVLARGFHARRRRNPAYSVRAFARDLGVSPNHLSCVIRGTKGLSAAGAERIARGLGLAGRKRREFILSAEALHAKADSARARADRELRTLARERRAVVVDPDFFADWRYAAFIQCLYLKDRVDDPEWYGSRLGISAAEVIQKINFLKRNRLVMRGPAGDLRPTKDYLTSLDQVSSAALRKFHSDALAKALVALRTVPPAERYFRSTLFPIRSRDIPAAQSALLKLHDQFLSRFDAGADADAVFFFNLQLFGLDGAERNEHA